MLSTRALDSMLSIRGFQEIQESDMLVVPDPTTAFLDPFATAAPCLDLQHQDGHRPNL